MKKKTISLSLDFTIIFLVLIFLRILPGESVFLALPSAFSQDKLSAKQKLRVNFVNKELINQEQRKSTFTIESQNGNYIGIKTYTEPRILNFTMQNSKGRILWQKDFAMATRLFVMNDGHCIVGLTTPDGLRVKSLEFCNTSGQKIKELVSDQIYGMYHSIDYVLIHDGTRLRMIDSTGKEVWVIETQVGNILISPDGEYIFNQGRGKAGWVDLYDRYGQLLHKLTFDAECSIRAISQNSRFIAIRSKYKLYIYEIQIQNVIWILDTSNLQIEAITERTIGVRDVVIYNNCNYFALTLTGISEMKEIEKDYGFTHFLFVLNESAGIEFRQFIGKGNFHPYVTISSDGKTISTRVNKEIQNFSVN